MVLNGVNCFRINLSHGTKDEKKSYFDLIKSISPINGLDRPSILADLAGPKVRLRKLDKPIQLTVGQSVIISSGERRDGVIPISKGLLFGEVDDDAKVMINDGKICLKIIKRLSEESFECNTIIGGKIKGKKGVNFLGVNLEVPSLTTQDEKDLLLALENGADWIALSFTRSKSDYGLIKEKINSFGSRTPVMAKIEKWEAVDNLDDIISAFDGVMVARGDLGVVLPLERVPVIQKEIIKKALIELGAEEKNINKVIDEAEKKEKDSNQILEFTKQIKNVDEDTKKLIIEALWKIIYSDNDADMYETNLMRRLSGLLYLDTKIVGDIKEKIKKQNQ